MARKIFKVYFYNVRYMVTGTLKERGMDVFNNISTGDVDTSSIKRKPYTSYYCRLYTFLARFAFTRFLPFLPDKSDMEKELEIRDTKPDNLLNENEV